MTHRAGVVGSPVDHSLSPLLHSAAYDALGLGDWTYHRHEVRAGELASYAASLPPDWRGLSVTMPGKEEALALAVTAGQEARQAGSANTLVRSAGGWHAENTDVAGLELALREEGVDRPPLVDVIGSGATARSALLALRRLGAGRVRLVVRGAVREPARELAQRLGLDPQVLRYDAWPGPGDRPDLVVSTVPPGAGPPVDSPPVGERGVVLDVVYAPWPTPLAAAVRRTGGRAVGGGTMLLHQAAAQVQLMTGHRAPVAAMRSALAARVPEITPG